MARFLNTRLLNTELVERSFIVTFPNGVADQKFDFQFSGFAGEMDVVLLGYYNTANASGSVTKRFSGYWYNNSGTPMYYVAKARYTEALGNAPNHFAVSDIGFDATAGKFYLRIAHLTSSGTQIGVLIRAHVAGGWHTAIRDGTVTSVFTTDTTVYPVPQIEYKSSVAFAGSYGAVNNSAVGAGGLSVGGAGTSPNAASMAWGDGSGWNLRLGYNNAGTFTPTFAFRDTGRLGINTTPDTSRLHVYDATDNARLAVHTGSTTSLPGAHLGFDATNTRACLLAARATGTLGAELAFFTKPDSATAATEYLTLDAAGKLATGKVQTGAAPGGTGAMTSIVNATAAEYGLLIRGAASQSASLLRWEDSAGNLLSEVDSAGKIVLPTGNFGSGGTSYPGDSASAGSGTTLARHNHVHGREPAAQSAATRYASTTSTNNITATSFAALPNSIAVSMTVGVTTRVMLNFAAWLVCNGSSGDVRVSVDISGNTTVAATPATEPAGTHDDFGWGDVLLFSVADNSGGASQRSATRFVTIFAGTTTFTIHAYKTGSPTSVQVNYPCIRVATIRTINP